MKKVLLDECVPRKFKNYLTGHNCTTVPEAGWAGKKNGELLSLAEAAGFQVFITLDRGVKYEQNLAGRRMAVIIIAAKTSRLHDLVPNSSQALATLESIEPGEIVRLP